MVPTTKPTYERIRVRELSAPLLSGVEEKLLDYLPRRAARRIAISYKRVPTTPTAPPPNAAATILMTSDCLTSDFERCCMGCPGRSRLSRCLIAVFNLLGYMSGMKGRFVAQDHTLVPKAPDHLYDEAF